MTDKELQLQAQVDRLEQQLYDAQRYLVNSHFQRETPAEKELKKQLRAAETKVHSVRNELVEKLKATEAAFKDMQKRYIERQGLQDRCDYFIGCNQMLERQLAEANLALSKAAEERAHAEKLKLNEGRREALRWTLEDPKWWMLTALAAKTSAEILARIEELETERDRIRAEAPETCSVCGQLLCPDRTQSDQERQAEKDDPDAYCEYCGNRRPGHW